MARPTRGLTVTRWSATKRTAQGEVLDLSILTTTEASAHDLVLAHQLRFIREIRQGRMQTHHRVVQVTITAPPEEVARPR